MRVWPIGGEQAFDVSQQLAGGTVDFQGRVLKVRKIDGQFNGSSDRGSTIYRFSNSLGLSGGGFVAEASGVHAVWFAPADGLMPKSHT